jgi:hypothetical protein
MAKKTLDLLELFPQLTYYVIPVHPTTWVGLGPPMNKKPFTALM